MRTIGVIGCGVVGLAVMRGFTDKGCTVIGYDKFKVGLDPIEKVLAESEMIFLCLPTPTNKNGQQNLDAMVEVFEKIKAENYQGIIVIKSTVLPGTTEYLAKFYGLRRVVHNPEFLTAARPYEDFMNQPCVLIGGPSDAALDVGDLYFELGFKGIIIRDCATYTEMAKYTHNVMLAARLNMANEFYERCKAAKIDYPKMITLAKAVGGIGETHLEVPGPDLKFGFAGMCFPKDTEALSRWDSLNGVYGEELEAVIKANKRRRPEGE